MMSITDVVSGAVHGWLSTTASNWFQVDRVIGLGPDWLAVLGHREGEQYDTLIALPAKAALDDNQAIMMALSQATTVREWGLSRRDRPGRARLCGGVLRRRVGGRGYAG